jgi:hypothetical protein
MKRLNPCKLKGQYLSQGRSGRRGAGGFLQKLSCCECRKPSLSQMGEFLRYKMEAEAGAVAFTAAKPGEAVRKGETLVTPCEEAFRGLQSIGTRRFKRALREKTKFTGCEPLEAALVKDGLVVHHQRDDTNPFLDGGADDVAPRTALSLTAFSRLNLGEKLASLRDTYPDQSLLFEEDSPGASILAPELTLQNLMAAQPRDLQAVTLLKLYEEGEFNQRGEDIKATAYLLFKGLTQKNLIKTVFPAYPVEKFAALKKQVFEIYRANRTKEEIVFEKFSKSLTPKQRKALELVYMGVERKSLSEAARQLGISVDTLKNRIEGGVKKLKAAFPEYAALKKAGRAPSNFKTDLAYDGFYRKSSAALIRPIKRLNQETKTWEPINMADFLRSRKQR